MEVPKDEYMIEGKTILNLAKDEKSKEVKLKTIFFEPGDFFLGCQIRIADKSSLHVNSEVAKILIR